MKRGLIPERCHLGHELSNRQRLVAEGPAKRCAELLRDLVVVEFDGSEVYFARVGRRIRQHRCNEAALVLGCDGRVATAP